MRHEKANMDEIKNLKVRAVFEQYSESMAGKLWFLRQLIFAVAMEEDSPIKIQETLKWGEPSYLSSKGSTIRIHKKNSQTQQYAMYFNCNTRLVDTFRELYPDLFSFEDNRAIVFNETDKIAVDELKNCIKMALIYHQIKHLPMLGARV